MQTEVNWRNSFKIANLMPGYRKKEAKKDSNILIYIFIIVCVTVTFTHTVFNEKPMKLCEISYKVIC